MLLDGCLTADIYLMPGYGVGVVVWAIGTQLSNYYVGVKLGDVKIISYLMFRAAETSAVLPLCFS